MAARALFLVALAFFGAAFFTNFALRAFLTGFAFLRATFFVCFFLVFFFGAIHAVYHQSDVPSRTCSQEDLAAEVESRRSGRCGVPLASGMHSTKVECAAALRGD